MSRLSISKNRLLFCAVLFVLLLSTLVASANEAELTAAQWLEKGNAFQAEKDYSNAIAAYSKAIGINPQLGQAYSERGKMYLSTKQFDLAIADYTKTIEFDPGNGELYWLRGLAHAGKGQHTLALQDYNKTLRLNSKMFLAYWTSALSYERIGAPNNALEAYTRFVELAPPDFPNVDQAKKRIAQLKAQDTARIAASAKNTEHLPGEQKKFVFDFLKTDYLTLDLGQPGWKIGFQQSAGNGYIIELVTGNETVKNWTELITVQFLPTLKHLSSGQYAAFVEKHYKDTYGDKARVNILRNSVSDALVEYRVVGQPGTKDEHTLTRIIKGSASLILVHYAAKPVMAPDKRVFGLGVLEGVRYSDHFPQ